MQKYPSIEQFRNLVKLVRLQHDYKGKDENDNSIYLNNSDYPILKFKGTVKIHGTNAAIVINKPENELPLNCTYTFQSRNNIITPEDDNFNFATEMSKLDLINLANQTLSEINKTEAVLYGEWCGPGIQNNVAVADLPNRIFVIFGLKINGKWVDLPETLKDHSCNIYNVNDFETFEVDIDFNKPELVQNKLIELTEQVELKCPVGTYFGIKGIGEGIVFNCVKKPLYMFKSKGEKHSVSKVKTLNSIDVELLNSIESFVEYAVTENRLLQGIEYLKEQKIDLDINSTGQFVKWVMSDIAKEELDTLTSNNLTMKNIAGAASKKASKWFINYLNTNLK